MMEAIAPVMPVSPGILPDLVNPVASVPQAVAGTFEEMVASGLREVDARLTRADALVQAYAEGAAIPVHQVTLALEQARIAVELAVEVRARLVETYRDFVNMQV